MCGRLGIITQKSLGQTIREAFSHQALKVMVVVLIFSAIIIGNGAYEAGNISGAALGLVNLFPGIPSVYIIFFIGLTAATVLLSGSYRIIEKLMISLVVVMSLIFVLTAIYIRPDITAILKGSLIPTFPGNSTLIIVGLIGTTVVPYNLFLHTSAAATKWHKEEDIKKARFDTFISVIIGGVISMSIIITSAAAMGKATISGAADLAVQLEPLLGELAAAFIALGLFAAGISSAITAALAAAFAASGIFGFKPDMHSLKFRAVSIAILVIGLIFSLSGFRPLEVIQFAQIANGILLPFVAVFLVWIMNRKILLGRFTNNLVQNILSILVVVITILLGIKSIVIAAGLF